MCAERDDLLTTRDAGHKRRLVADPFDLDRREVHSGCDIVDGPNPSTVAVVQDGGDWNSDL